MTLFSIILSSLRPPEEIWRRRKLKCSEKVRITLYKWVLRRGLKAYRKYAVYDVVSLDGGRVSITHEYRDHAFEKELKTAKVISQLSFKTSLFPFKSSAAKRNFKHRWFDFTDVLKVEADGRELRIEHGELYAASSKGRASVKRTKEDDYIMAALYTLTGSQTSKRTPVQTSAPAATPAPAKRPAGKSGRSAGKGMFGNTVGSGLNLPQPGDSTPAPEVPSQSAPEVPPQPVPKVEPQPESVSVQVPEPEPIVVISKRGLDIDTSF